MNNLPEARPQQPAPTRNLREIHCPFCDSTDVELFSLYGQTLLGSQYSCHSCKSIFEAIRYDETAIVRSEGFNAPDTASTDKQNPSDLEANHEL